MLPGKVVGNKQLKTHVQQNYVSLWPPGPHTSQPCPACARGAGPPGGRGGGGGRCRLPPRHFEEEDSPRGRTGGRKEKAKSRGTGTGKKTGTEEARGARRCAGPGSPQVPAAAPQRRGPAAAELRPSVGRGGRQTPASGLGCPLFSFSLSSRGGW